jgi:hypothetical protein
VALPTDQKVGGSSPSERAKYLRMLGSLARCVVAYAFLFAPSRSLSRLEIISS